MKKTMKIAAVLLAVVMAMSVTAEASEMRLMVSPTLSISSNTATCTIKVSKPGRSISVTLYLYRDGVSIMSWTRSDTSTVEINETYTVTTGHTYYTYAYVTTGGHSYTGQSGSITI